MSDVHQVTDEVSAILRQPIWELQIERLAVEASHCREPFTVAFSLSELNPSDRALTLIVSGVTEIELVKCESTSALELDQAYLFSELEDGGARERLQLLGDDNSSMFFTLDPELAALRRLTLSQHAFQATVSNWDLTAEISFMKGGDSRISLQGMKDLALSSNASVEKIYYRYVSRSEELLKSTLAIPDADSNFEMVQTLNEIVSISRSRAR